MLLNNPQCSPMNPNCPQWSSMISKDPKDPQSSPIILKCDLWCIWRKHPKPHPKKADEKQREKAEKSDYLDLRELYSRGQKACFRPYQVTILKSLRPSYELTWFFLNAKDVPLFLFVSTIRNLNLSKCHLSFSFSNLAQQLSPKMYNTDFKSDCFYYL